VARLREVLGAAMLGVAAILMPKNDPDRHWSEVPTLVVDVADPGTASGPDGPEPARPAPG
jgi:hypothetical protein